ncbi:polyribonucleotide nucleotidyltransferase [Candidatus Aerophobetes bacterium]|nr:polyribonucleotide nucleotidyltransferase [Candidatus Aerophobetes bacterium]
MYRVEREFEGEKIIIETGKVAKKSSGAAWVQYGENIVLVTSVISPTIIEGTDFTPLTVDYREKAYAAGKIPGGFFKREGKPSEEEILSSRLIDRSIRPLFPKGFKNETQIIATVLSASESNLPSILGITGASVALALSDKIITRLVGGVRIARVDGEFIINPTDKQLEKSDIDLVVAGDIEGIIMVEGRAGKVPESCILQALERAHLAIKKLIEIEKELVEKIGEIKSTVTLYQIDKDFEKEVIDFLDPLIENIKPDWSKQEKENYLEEVKEKLTEKFLSQYPEKENDLLSILEELKRKKLRKMIIQEGKRWDGRGPDEIRPISCEVGILPRVHGSSLFTRGETQCLVVTTLGTSSDEQIIDGLQREEITKRFMFHYNFPPFSTGEVRRMGAPGRREIGHGFLAERALMAVLPEEDKFPYTIRLVSDILESNGSSSMASVCGGSLALMDAGVPISEAVAGVAMGLVKENGKAIILTDIQGIEDHCGDMDFKIAGTKDGITALQLDIKTDKVGFDILTTALEKAKIARKFILEKMCQVIEKPRESLSKHAPRIATLTVPLEKIADIIGPGGRVIKKIIQETGARIDIDDTEGKVTVSSMSEDSTNRALKMIRDIVKGFKVGKIYLGKVKRITNFGAFVEISPGKEGLVHISELSDKYVKDVSEIVRPGDEILVKIIGIDELGRITLSKKKADQVVNRGTVDYK